MLVNPYSKLQQGDQSVSRERLVNENEPEWQNISSIGSPISNFPNYIFRRPVVDPLVVKLNDAYEALIYPDRVTVGCSRFTHEVILEVAEKIKELSKVDKL